MLFFYIRHGDPIYDPDDLTPLGERQAEAIAKRLAIFGIDEIYSSTSTRAIKTSVPTCELLKKERVLLDFANEGHAWNEFTVKTASGGMSWVFQYPESVKLLASKETTALGHKWYDNPVFAEYRESFVSGMKRINNETDKFFASLGYVHDRENGIYKVEKPSDKRIALFAHQGFGLAFLSSILDIPYPKFTLNFDMGHSQLTVIEFRELDGISIPKVLTFSNDSHIYREGLPLKYQNRVYF